MRRVLKTLEWNDTGTWARPAQLLAGLFYFPPCRLVVYFAADPLMDKDLELKGKYINQVFAK